MSKKLFTDFALPSSIQKALDSLGFINPTEIQEQAIPLLLESGKTDIHCQAQTGTGKTLAFGIPLLARIDVSNRSPQVLVVAPTRELVLQICESLKKTARYMDVSIEPIYGGVSIQNQIRSLRRGVQVIVGTPGRLRDHLRRKTLSLKDLHIFVLDEADIMLDMGFKEEIDDILTHAPVDREIWLFSATVKPGIKTLKKTHMHNPVSVRTSNQKVTTANTKQFYCTVPMRYRLQALCRVIDSVPNFYGLIFCQTKILTNDIAERLTKHGYSAACLHGDMDQKIRTRVIKKFKDKAFDILVATDVAARGIDVSCLTHVINYSIPEDQESYVHRIGRTGRAGNDGTAITFISTREVRRMQQLAQRFDANIEKLETPTVADVMRLRIEKSIAYFNEICKKQSDVSNDKLETLHTTIAQSTKEQLLNGVIGMLIDKYLRGHENEREIPSVCPTERSLHDGDTRELMLDVGSVDGIDRDNVLQYCLETDTVKRGQIERIRVIKRRSFVILPSDNANELIKALKGKKLNGKRIRVSFATPNGNERSSRGSFGGSRGSFGGGGGRGRSRFGGGGGGRSNAARRRSSASWGG